MPHIAATGEEAPEDRRCTAHSKRHGGRCKAWRVKGLTVCYHHGGASKKARKAGEQRYAEDQARAALSRAAIVVPDNVDPTVVLMSTVRVAAANVDWLTNLLAEFDTPLGHNRFYEQVEHPLWKVYGEERERLARFCSEAIKCGLAERQVSIAEEQSQLIVRVLQGVLRDCGVEIDEIARHSMRRHLMAATGTPTPLAIEGTA